MAFSCSWLTGASAMLPFWLATPLTMMGDATGTASPTPRATMVPSSVLLLLIFLDSVAVFALSFTFKDCFYKVAFCRVHDTVSKSCIYFSAVTVCHLFQLVFIVSFQLLNLSGHLCLALLLRREPKKVELLAFSKITSKLESEEERASKENLLFPHFSHLGFVFRSHTLPFSFQKLLMIQVGYLHSKTTNMLI